MRLHTDVEENPREQELLEEVPSALLWVWRLELREPGLCLFPPQMKLLWVSGSILLEEAASESEPIRN